MARKYYKVTAVVIKGEREKDVISSIQTNTSIVGAIKDMEKMAERSGIEKIEVIKVINLAYNI